MQQSQEREHSFRDYTGHIFASLSSAAGQCNSSRLRTAAFAAHVVNQTQVQMLCAEMRRCVEDVKIGIGKSQ